MAPPVRIVCPEDFPVKILKWKVKKDSMVMKGSILGLYENPKTSSHIKLKSSATGIVDEIYVETGMECQPGMLLLTLRQQDSGGCTHPTVMKEMCADCGADLRRESEVVGDHTKKMSASVAMVHNIPELIVSQEQALELGREDEERLLKTRKLVLLVDLDQTLIHTTNDNIPPRLKDVFHFQLWQQRPHSSWYHTRLRPHTHTFLQKISKMYELHICTFGVRLYAHTVARLIDPDEKFFSHRILSRDECFDPLSKTANLKALFPCGDSMVCIIDDREDVWNHAPNLVHVKPYRFFQGTADINAPPGLEKSENDDVPLVHKVVDHHNGTPTDASESNEKGSQETHEAEEQKGAQKTEKSDEQKGSEETEEQKGSEETEEQKGTKKTEKSEEQKGSEETPKTEGEGSQSTDRPRRDQTAAEGGQCGEPETGNMDTDPVDAQKAVTESGDGVERKEEECGGGQVAPPPTDTSELAQDLCMSSDSDDSRSSRSQLLEKGEAAAPAVDAGPSDSAETLAPSQGVSSQESTTSPSDSTATQDAAAHSDSTQDGADKSEGTKSAGGQTASSAPYAQPGEAEKGNQDSGETAEASAESGGKKEEKGEEEEEEGEEVEWDDEDDYLLHLEEILTRIHQAFYAMIDEKRPPDAGAQQQQEEAAAAAPRRKGGLPDLKSIIPYVKRKTLKGCNVVLSGMVPLNSPPDESPACRLARALGARVQRDVVATRESGGRSRETTTHLVAAKPGTSKHKAALRTKGVRVVGSGWLWTCGERWERCDERLFPLASLDSPGQSSSASASASQPKAERKEHHRSKPSKRRHQHKGEHDDRRSRGKKRSRKEAEKEVKNGGRRSAEGGSWEEEGTSALTRRSSTFAETVPTLLAFSDEDLECMDKEVDELMAEESGSDDETDNERDQRIRDRVLGSVSESSSSSDSLSADLPRGWGLRRKSKSLSPKVSDDDLEKRKHEAIEVETEDTENESVRFHKTAETFSHDSDSNNSSYAESIGSVDDEMAEAVEKQFLASL